MQDKQTNAWEKNKQKKKQKKKKQISRPQARWSQW